MNRFQWIQIQIFSFMEINLKISICNTVAFLSKPQWNNLTLQWLPGPCSLFNTLTNILEILNIWAIGAFYTHWNENITILTKFSSLVVPEVVILATYGVGILTTSGAASDKILSKQQHFSFSATRHILVLCKKPIHSSVYLPTWWIIEQELQGSVTL